MAVIARSRCSTEMYSSFSFVASSAAAIEDFVESAGCTELARGAGSGDAREPFDPGEHGSAHGCDVGVHSFEHARDQSVVLVDQCEEQVIDRDLLVAVSQRQCLGFLQGLL